MRASGLGVAVDVAVGGGIGDGVLVGTSVEAGSPIGLATAATGVAGDNDVTSGAGVGWLSHAATIIIDMNRTHRILSMQ
jgi:hypothetical protein